MPVVLGSFNETHAPPPGARRPHRVRTYRLWFPTIAGQIRFLRREIDRWRGRTWTRRLAVSIIREQCDEKNQLCHALALARAVRDRVYYVNERPETFQIPPITWQWGFGDCDDFTWLLGALIESVGIPVEVDGMRLNRKWKHVFPVAMIPVKKEKRRARIPLDATLRAPLGTNPVTIALRQGFEVETYRLKSRL